MNDPAEVLRAISDPTRFAIITILLNHDVCSGAVARRLGISDAAVSQHMKILKEVGLVTPERHGYFTHYAVDRTQLIAASEMLAAMAGVERMPCDPDLEQCDRRERCPADKRTGGCPRAAEGRPECRGCPGHAITGTEAI